LRKSKVTKQSTFGTNKNEGIKSPYKYKVAELSTLYMIPRVGNGVIARRCIEYII